jgi:Dolichyl-phosphate-mannose-protein mannosyltransferase
MRSASCQQGDRLARRSRRAGWPTDHILLTFLAATVTTVAVGLRVGFIDRIPRLTDETDSVVRSLDILRSGSRPLTDTDAYIGAVFNYILATTFAVFGIGPVVPRYLVAAAGVLTVVATFCLAGEISALVRRSHHRRAWGRTDAVVGLIAAAMLAVSPVHILVNSRIAWAHSTTPLFTTLALAILVRAVRREQQALLPPAGLLAGIALQTHPSVIALLPGTVAWLVWSGKQALLSRRWVLLAVLLGGVGCANLLVYNLVTGFDSVHAALDTANAYDAQEGGHTGYAGALWLEGLGLARLLAGTIGTRRGDEPPMSFEILAWAALLLVLVAYAARRGATIVPLVIVPFLLLLPLLNTKYEPLFNGRYLMPIVPLVAASWALAVTAAHGRLQAAQPVAGLLAIIAVIVTLTLPVRHFVAYQRVALATGSNEAYASLAQRIREAHDPDESVLVDEALGGERIASGRRGVSVVEYFLLLSPNPPNVRVGDADEFIEYLDAHHDQALLVLLPRLRRRLGAQYDLTPVGAPPRGQEQSIRNAGLFRAEIREE